jgi:hypothetical protein
MGHTNNIISSVCSAEWGPRCLLDWEILGWEVRLLVFQTGGLVNIYSQELCKQYLRVLPTTCAPIATELLEVPGWLIFVVVLSSLTSAIRAFEGPGLNKLFQVGLI